MKREGWETFLIHFDSPTAEKSESSLFLIWRFSQPNPRKGRLLTADSASFPFLLPVESDQWIDKCHWLPTQPCRGLPGGNLHTEESKPEKQK